MNKRGWDLNDGQNLQIQTSRVHQIHTREEMDLELLGVHGA